MPDEDEVSTAPNQGPAAYADNNATDGWYTVEQANQALAAPVAAVGASGGFLIDPERLRECIAELTRIVEDVRVWMVGGAPLRFEPPGFDEVSLNFARAGTIMAGRADAFVAAWAHQIEAARDGLQAQLDHYVAVDQDNARRFA